MTGDRTFAKFLWPVRASEAASASPATTNSSDIHRSTSSAGVQQA